MKKSTKPQWVPCFLCGNFREVRKSKREKPYIVCDPCGVQIFIRRETGIELLNGLIISISRNKTSFFFPSIGDPRLLALVNRMEQLQAKREELNSQVGIFNWEGSNKGKNVAIKALDGEIERLQKVLRAL